MFDAIRKKISSAYKQLQPTIAAGNKTIANAWETGKEGAKAIFCAEHAVIDLVETVHNAVEGIAYTIKGAAYDAPCYLANKYGTHVDKDGVALDEAAKNKTIAESWKTLTTDLTAAKTDLIKALEKGWQTVKDVASTVEHTAKFAVNVSTTLYRAGETVVDAGIAAKDAAVYAVKDGVVPAATFVGKNAVVPAVQYIGKQPIPSITTLFEIKRAQAKPIEIEMDDLTIPAKSTASSLIASAA